MLRREMRADEYMQHNSIYIKLKAGRARVSEEEVFTVVLGNS